MTDMSPAAAARWAGTVNALAALGERAHASDERRKETRRWVGESRGTADKDRLNTEFLQAVVVSKVYQVGYMHRAHVLLKRRAAGRAPVLRPVRVVPGVPARWRDWVNDRHAGVWRAIPDPGPENALSAAEDPLVLTVRDCALALQASREGYRRRDSLYEAYVPDDPGSPLMGGRPVPPIPGLPENLSRRVNRLLGRGAGIRVIPERQAEMDQLQTDYFAVWERAMAYGDAVVNLLRGTMPDGL